MSSPHLKITVWPVLVLSVVGALSSHSIIIMWLFLELNTMSFLLIISSNTPAQASLKYFILQSISSSLILLGNIIFLHTFNSSWNLLITMMIFLKLGLPPLHLWLFNLVSLMPLWNIFILSSLQKIIPLLLFFLAAPLTPIPLIVILSCITLLVLTPPISLVKPLLALSSVFTNAWLICTSPAWAPSFFYLVIYSLNLMLIIFLFHNTNLLKIPETFKFKMTPLFLFTWFLLMLNIGGIPPLMGFLAKITSASFLVFTSSLLLPLTLMITSIFILILYLQPIYLALSFNNPHSFFPSSQPSISVLTSNLLLIVFPIFLWLPMF